MTSTSKQMHTPDRQRMGSVEAVDQVKKLLKRLLWDESLPKGDLELVLDADEGGSAVPQRLCASALRGRECKYGAHCKFDHGFSLASAGVDGWAGRGTGSFAPQDRVGLVRRDLRTPKGFASLLPSLHRVNFVLVGGVVAWDRESPSRWDRFVMGDEAVAAAEGNNLLGYLDAQTCCEALGWIPLHDCLRCAVVCKAWRNAFNEDLCTLLFRASFGWRWHGSATVGLRGLFDAALAKRLFALVDESQERGAPITEALLTAGHTRYATEANVCFALDPEVDVAVTAMLDPHRKHQEKLRSVVRASRLSTWRGLEKVALPDQVRSVVTAVCMTRAALFMGTDDAGGILLRSERQDLTAKAVAHSLRSGGDDGGQRVHELRVVDERAERVAVSLWRRGGGMILVVEFDGGSLEVLWRSPSTGAECWSAGATTATESAPSVAGMDVARLRHGARAIIGASLPSRLCVWRFPRRQSSRQRRARGGGVDDGEAAPAVAAKVHALSAAPLARLIACDDADDDADTGAVVCLALASAEGARRRIVVTAARGSAALHWWEMDVEERIKTGDDERSVLGVRYLEATRTPDHARLTRYGAHPMSAGLRGVLACVMGDGSACVWHGETRTLLLRVAQHRGITAMVVVARGAVVWREAEVRGRESAGGAALQDPFLRWRLRRAGLGGAVVLHDEAPAEGKGGYTKNHTKSRKNSTMNPRQSSTRVGARGRNKGGGNRGTSRR